MKPDTPLHAVRLKCLDCSAGQVAEVRLCTVTKCPLYAYRMGHRPKKTASGGDKPDSGAVVV